ncbi:MAG: phosphoribosylaminoimidazolesuccinocarboxamide synthase [Acidaminococcaceae bacterium]
MELVYTGKTKNVYKLVDGNYLLKFKDDCTGNEGVFDPGSNTIGLTMEGAGRAGLRLTKYFFEILQAEGVPTHYLEADITEASMKVKPATVFGKGLEVICRFRAVGSFYRRYGEYCSAEGQELPAFVEVTLKDDGREDPPITKDALVILGILTEEEYETLKIMTQKIAGIVKAELQKKDIELYDIKFEFGRVGKERTITLIDEISGGNMRAFKNGEYLQPLILEKLVLEE